MPDSPGLETLFVRLYFDRHIMSRLAVDLRGRGFDVLTSEEARKDSVSDEEQLAFFHAIWIDLRNSHSASSNRTIAKNPSQVADSGKTLTFVSTIGTS